MDALVTFANVLNAAGYFVKDRLWLRALSYVATCSLTYYFATRPEPLTTVVYWNLLFATLNAGLLSHLALERLRGA